MISGEVLAPKALIIPRSSTAQMISGAIWISGSTLIFFPYDGTNTIKYVTAS